MRAWDVPTLAELYEACGSDYELSIDVKHEDAGLALIAVAQTAGAVDRLWLCHDEVRPLVDMRAASGAVCLVHSPDLRVIQDRFAAHVAELARVDIDVLNMRWRAWTPERVEAVQAHGLLAFAWDANDDLAFQRLIGLGSTGSTPTTRTGWSPRSGAIEGRRGRQTLDERCGSVEDVLEDRLHPMPEPRIGHRSPCGSRAIASRSRSIRANGSDSPDRSRAGQAIAGQWAIRGPSSGPPGRWSGYEKQTRPRYPAAAPPGPLPAAAAARLATRPPNECPPTTTSGPGGASSSQRGTTSSALRLGRSTAIASIPRDRSPSTNGAMLAAVPDAPWPRTTRMLIRGRYRVSSRRREPIRAGACAVEIDVRQLLRDAIAT